MSDGERMRDLLAEYRAHEGTPRAKSAHAELAALVERLKRDRDRTCGAR